MIILFVLMEAKRYVLLGKMRPSIHADLIWQYHTTTDSPSPCQWQWHSLTAVACLNRRVCPTTLQKLLRIGWRNTTGAQGFDLAFKLQIPIQLNINRMCRNRPCLWRPHRDPKYLLPASGGQTLHVRTC